MADANAAKKQKPAEDPEDKAAEAAGAKDKKALILIALVAINSIVLLAVGGGLFMYVQSVKKAQPTAITEEETPAAGEHGKAADAHGAPKGATAAHEGEAKIVSLDPFFVNLQGSEGYKLLKVAMSFEVQSATTQEELVKRQAQIKDIIIVLLSSKSYSEISGENAQQKIKEEIKDTINSFLPHGEVKKVLFTEFIFN